MSSRPPECPRFAPQLLTHLGSDRSPRQRSAQDRCRLEIGLQEGVRLEAVVASHPHQDHTNFYPELLRQARGNQRRFALPCPLAGGLDPPSFLGSREGNLVLVVDSRPAGPL